MANENLGTIGCQFHDEPYPAHVREDKKGKLYIYCDLCGITSPRAAKFQEYMNKNMRPIVGATPEPTPEPTPEATPEPTLEPTPEATPEATPEPVRKTTDQEMGF